MYPDSAIHEPMDEDAEDGWLINPCSQISYCRCVKSVAFPSASDQYLYHLSSLSLICLSSLSFILKLFTTFRRPLPVFHHGFRRI